MMEQIRTIIGPSFQLLSNWCSMGCAGCGIHVAAPHGSQIMHLDEKSVEHAKRNLCAVKKVLDGLQYRYAMVEQSGGEPSHFPQIVEAIGEVFPDCIHKIITNGLTSDSLLPYLLRRRDRTFLVLSVDHHEIEVNQLRFGSTYKRDPSLAIQKHKTILKNLDLFLRYRIPVVVSTIISKWNIERYLNFVAWLEGKYPEQINDGILVPMPVSLVSFGNSNLGRLNPTTLQVDEFEEEIEQSTLLTIVRMRDWFHHQMIGHYRNKQRFFERLESLDDIEEKPSRQSCEIFRFMISFNFQDEEILREKGAIFEGYCCGVKVLGNIGRDADRLLYSRLRGYEERPSNIRPGKKYFSIDEAKDYVLQKERITSDEELVSMGGEVGYFSTLRRGMCLIDDFDGVWWPFNIYLHGDVKEETLRCCWSLFRNGAFLSQLRHARDEFAHFRSLEYLRKL